MDVSTVLCIVQPMHLLLYCLILISCIEVNVGNPFPCERVGGKEDSSSVPYHHYHRCFILIFFQYFYFDSAGVVNLLLLYFSAMHLAKYGLTSVITIN